MVKLALLYYGAKVCAESLRTLADFICIESSAAHDAHGMGPHAGQQARAAQCRSSWIGYDLELHGLNEGAEGELMLLAGLAQQRLSLRAEAPPHDLVGPTGQVEQQAEVGLLRLHSLYV